MSHGIRTREDITHGEDMAARFTHGLDTAHNLLGIGPSDVDHVAGAVVAQVPGVGGVIGRQNDVPAAHVVEDPLRLDMIEVALLVGQEMDTAKIVMQEQEHEERAQRRSGDAARIFGPEQDDAQPEWNADQDPSLRVGGLIAEQEERVYGEPDEHADQGRPAVVVAAARRLRRRGIVSFRCGYTEAVVGHKEGDESDQQQRDERNDHG